MGFAVDPDRSQSISPAPLACFLGFCKCPRTIEALKLPRLHSALLHRSNCASVPAEVGRIDEYAGSLAGRASG